MSQWQDIIRKLETGELRAANKIDGRWVANKEVKEGILEAFRNGDLALVDSPAYPGFVDKHNLPVQQFKPENKIRLVPGGSSVRAGAFVSPGVVIMPPAYINIGAYVDSGTMVDSHALVGSCAQIGKNVHLSAGVQIGGVLEPIGQAPVVIEDNAFLAAGSVVVEGIQVSENAVLAPGVALSKATPIYDCVNEKMITDHIIPAGAVVVPGTRPVSDKYKWAKDQGLSLNCALIIKYRDAKTDSSLVLEEALR